MTERTDVLRKVRALIALADDEYGVPEERESARAKATALRLRHGISDAEVEPEPEDDIQLLGLRLGWYRRRIGTRVERIRAEIEAAVAEARTNCISEQEQLETICRLYKDLHEVVEGTAYTRSPMKAVRDIEVKAFYEFEKEKYIEEHSSRELDQMLVHSHARDYTAIYSDLRKDHVERIVGVSEKALWAQYWREHPEDE